MVWMETAVFALFIIAGGSWIAAIYIGLESAPETALMFGTWATVAVLGLCVLFQDLINGHNGIALTGAIIGVGLTVIMYEPETDNQQTV